MEDNVIWRIAELLGVSVRDRVLQRQQVASHKHLEGHDEADADAI